MPAPDHRTLPPERPAARDPHDDTLIERAQHGDLDSFGELVRRHQRDARRAAAAIGGPDVADDCAQEAFVRAYRALPRFRVGAPFRPWLLTIVVNVARNHHRSSVRWTRGAQRSIDDRTGGAGRAERSAEDVVLDADRSARLGAALATLPTRCREVVACRYLLELTEQETAEVLGVPPGTVKSRLSRGLDRLAAQLREEAFDG